MTEYTCDSFRFFNLFPVYFGGKGTTGVPHHDIGYEVHLPRLGSVLTLSDGSLTLLLPGPAVFAANSRNSFLKSHAAGRIHGCSVRLPYIPGSALTNSPSDTHFALPVHLPSYHRLDRSLEKLTVRFSSFALLSHF